MTQNSESTTAYVTRDAVCVTGPHGPADLIDSRVGNDLILVDYSGRRFRNRKAQISARPAGILDRIGIGAESWQHRMEKPKTA